ncbi:hypothetical protein ACFFRR_004257 [Megaselia abdita]
MLLGFFSIYNKNANELSEALENYVGEDASDLSIIFARSMMDTATETTMGKSLDTGHKLDLLPQYQICLKALILQMTRPWFQIDFLFKFHNLYEPVKRAVLIIRKTIYTFIEVNLKELENNEGLENNEESQKPMIFIKQALKLFQENKFTLEDVFNESNTIIVGAIETTSTAIHNTIFCLAEHTEFQEKLFAEIMAVIPDDVEITYKHLLNMPYLTMTINESLRLLPPIMFTTREASDIFQIKDDSWVPKGAQFMISIYHIQRNKKYWGPKAEEYDPDNFSDENVAQRNPNAFLPFSKGVRNCIGMRYAQFALKVTLVKLIRKYKFTTDHKLKNLVIIPNITMHFKDIPKLKVTLR